LDGIICRVMASRFKVLFVGILFAPRAETSFADFLLNSLPSEEMLKESHNIVCKAALIPYQLSG
jgi:hypothetical protein